jgi:ketosteroid isomerase-like protein
MVRLEDRMPAPAVGAVQFIAGLQSKYHVATIYTCGVTGKVFMQLQEMVQQYHAAADAFSRGDPAPVKSLCSNRDDVTLANPFGPAVRGWSQVSAALDFASSRFRDGEVTNFETVARYEASELATILEIERWTAKVGGRPDWSSFELRVTSTFRREDGSWRLVHRHADPISTPNPDGPLRG